jgi:PAS domain S-box-containing protein
MPERVERTIDIGCRVCGQVTSDLIRASELGELGRKTFQHISGALGAVVCTNFRLDPAAHRLRLVFVHGIPSEYLEAAQSLELGQEYCGTVAATCQPLVADRQRIASDPNGGLVRELGATAYACYPLKASDGRLLGTFAVASASRDCFTDDEVTWLGMITNFLAQAWERFEAEQDLRVSEERLRLSQEAAGLGHWDYDFASGTLVWSERTRKLLGVEAGAPASRALLLSRVHVEDRPRVEKEIARSSDPDSDHVYHAEFRVLMQNGALRWLEDQGRVKTDAAGLPIRAFGVMRDITERKNAEGVQAHLAAIVTSSADAIIGKTLDGIVTSWNEAAERMFGYSAMEMIGESIRRLIPADRQPEEDMILARLARSESIEHYQTMRLTNDGRAFDASITVSPVRDTEGRIIGASKILRDITARKQAEQALQASKDRLEFALDAAQLGWWHYDPLRRVISGDARAQQIFDATPGDIPIEDIVTKRLHPDDAETVWAAFQAALDPTDPQPYAIEYRVQQADGEVRWVEAHGLAHFEGAGRERRIVSIVGTVQDITERKEREEKEHLLMREINHRAKNMLSVADAIAHQSVTRNPEDFVERFSERIQALSANQDLLVRNEWNGVEIEDLVRVQLALFADLIGSRVTVHGPKLRLNAASAQAIGLALHELATNAGKYGALSTDTGRVNIRWGTDGDTFSMSWTERDGPPVALPKQRGFGTIVMEAMAERSVHGTVDLDYAASGLTWRLTCPAPNALEPWEREQTARDHGKPTDGATGNVKLRTTA